MRSARTMCSVHTRLRRSGLNRTRRLVVRRSEVEIVALEDLSREQRAHIALHPHDQRPSIVDPLPQIRRVHTIKTAPRQRLRP